jgi:putative endonuclease
LNFGDYIGSCLDIEKRLEDHRTKKFRKSFVARADDWMVYYVIDGLAYKQARLMEKHIKRMKSRKYIENLKLYSGISEKLKQLYT